MYLALVPSSVLTMSSNVLVAMAMVTKSLQKLWNSLRLCITVHCNVMYDNKYVITSLCVIGNNYCVI